MLCMIQETEVSMIQERDGNTEEVKSQRDLEQSGWASSKAAASAAT